MTIDRQRAAEGLAALRAAATGTPMRDRLTAWLTNWGEDDDEADLAELVRHACVEAHYHHVCPQCGYVDNTVDDVVEEVQNRVLDLMLDEQQAGEHR